MRVMERSLQTSWAQADGGIDTEHLLVAYLEQEDETTEAVLAGLDINPEEGVHSGSTLCWPNALCASVTVERRQKVV